jgi:hypothetical protein
MRIFRENLPKVVDGLELCAAGEYSAATRTLGQPMCLAAPRDLEPLADKLHGALRGTPRVLTSTSAPRRGFARSGSWRGTLPHCTGR